MQIWGPIPVDWWQNPSGHVPKNHKEDLTLS